MEPISPDFPQLADIQLQVILAVLGSLFPVVVVFLLRLRRRRKGIVRPSDQIKASRLAHATGAHLPADVSLLAGLGSNRGADETLGELFLRPTWGVRLVPVAIVGLLYFFASGLETAHGLVLSAFDLWAFVTVAAGCAYVFLYFMIYELRYDRDRFAHRNFFFQYREFNWSDISGVRQDGGYYYVISTTSGKKTYVLKYLSGIEDFLALLLSQIEKNSRL